MRFGRLFGGGKDDGSQYRDDHQYDQYGYDDQENSIYYDNGDDYDQDDSGYSDRQMEGARAGQGMGAGEERGQDQKTAEMMEAQRLKDIEVYQQKRAIALKERNETLVSGMAYADEFVTKGYLSRLKDCAIEDPGEPQEITQYRIFRLDRFVLDKKEDINEKLVSIYGALHSIDAAAFVIVRSKPTGVSFYIGTRNPRMKESEIGRSGSLAGNTLSSALEGNFTGSTYKQMEVTETTRLMDECVGRGNLAYENSMNVAAVTALPSLRDEKNEFVQGIEKLIDALRGQEYTAIFLAEPLSAQAVAERRLGLEQLYSTLSPYSKTSLAYGENYSYAVSEGMTKGFSKSINSSVTHSNSESTSKTHSITKGKSVSRGRSTTDGVSNNFSSGFTEQGFDGTSSNSGSSFGTSHSVGSSVTRSTSESATESFASSSSWSESVTQGSSESISVSGNENKTETKGDSRTLTVTHENKSVEALMEKIDAQLKRIKDCESFGLWNAGAYFISSNQQTVTSASSLYRSLITGENSRLELSYINYWMGCKKDHLVLKSLRQLHHPQLIVEGEGEFQRQMVRPTALVSGKELPIFLNLPRKSISGMVVDTMASFGRQVYYNGVKPSHLHLIRLGCVQHMGILERKNPIYLDRELLRSHCFITGSTGSGKSNTTYHLLGELKKNNIPFLVVEPAKGEYKLDLAELEGLNVFWTNPEEYPLLRINPFRFSKGIHVLEHLDRLIEIFNVCWPLYSAMPSILKQAVQQSYISVGWDLIGSVYLGEGKERFPTFLDLIEELKNVINASNYSAETKGEYIGALVTRVQGLTTGIQGQVFCDSRDIDDSTLFDRYTVVDLSRASSTEVKSLIMGVLVMRLNEYRIANAKGATNQPLRHVTVLEEAHNLLKRVSPGSGSEMQQKSVEMISSSIAEMRTFGEGFLIVDQSPSSVDISAIKNTNTKIVMNLPLKEDFEVISGSFALSPEQAEEIPRLGNGCAIVKQSSWLEPLMVKVDYAGAAGNDYRLKPEHAVLYDREAVVEVRSRICVLAYQQWNDRKLSARELIECMEGAKLNKFKKAEYEALIRHFAQQCSAVKTDAQRWEYFGDFLFRILGCRGVFQAIALKLGSDDGKNKTLCAQWKTKMLRALSANYLYCSSEKTLNYLFYIMVWYLSSQEGAKLVYTRYRGYMNKK